MRIGIDARFFGPQETGLGRYVDRLVSHLARLDTTNEYVLFVRSGAWDYWEPPNPRWEKVRADFRWYSLTEQLRFPGLIQKAKLDLMHFPHFNVPLRYRGPFVVTVHDLTLNKYPTARASTLGPWLYWLKYFAYRIVITQAVRRAQSIICVSEHTKHDVMKEFRVDPKRITVTYESVDPLPPAVDRTQLETHGVRQPYFLHVGNAYPHKNLERLIEAWQHFRASEPRPVQLVFVGKPDYFARRLQATVAERRIPDIQWFGFANDSELASLYQHAQAYIFPSLYEGFGLPGLEAMQAGIPVYAARASCLPEIYGNAARYFDPWRVDEMVTSMRSALHDTLERTRLVAAGKERLKRFSWDVMAKQTLSVYVQYQPQPTHS